MISHWAATTIIQESILRGREFWEILPNILLKFSCKFSSLLLTMAQLVRIMMRDCSSQQAPEHMQFW